ncbi:NAD(P)(+) transhydrogenase (Re/Si-specific) subunit beta [Rubrivivax gelatinosus]|uniref:NAD(P)(+) transhydrogenase (Re/Si-specific) subunit beta n=1 Tax=Rubrivivax gelatinosus TaxID=28068 RepID=UPI0002E4FDA9|nr:NAD(P)(+) transhydrogenase (Re/Si-specific) subunit beta [Rubrivivax gelatinosus]
MSASLVTLLYLVASICFIQALKGLSHPTTSIRGNVFGMVGMTIAVLTTAALIVKLAGGGVAGLGYVLVGLVVGGGAGAVMAQRVEMTKMPELVAFMHSMIGLAAVFIAVAVVAEPQAFAIAAAGEPIPVGNRIELFLGAAIGAITFSGSVIAFGKLSGKYKFRLFQGAPVRFAGQHWLNLVLGLATIGLGIAFAATQRFEFFIVLIALAFVLGVLLIIPIGGADMPVVVSMLNSYSGWAAAGIGFSLNNSMLIIAGSLVGSSGAILSYIMCKAMNRSFFNVILGGFGGEGTTAAAGGQAQRSVKSGTEKGVTVKYAIHPVAGRMPGHMNVLLAEAEVPYDQVFEMEDINAEFGQADVAIILGANDVVNPAAHVKGSPIYGMPILEAYKAKTVIVNTMMVFGDAKKVVEDMVKSVD